jgi:hypothetical protein
LFRLQTGNSICHFLSLGTQSGVPEETSRGGSNN